MTFSLLNLVTAQAVKNIVTKIEKFIKTKNAIKIDEVPIFISPYEDLTSFLNQKLFNIKILIF